MPLKPTTMAQKIKSDKDKIYIIIPDTNKKNKKKFTNLVLDRISKNQNGWDNDNSNESNADPK